tara:strand:+ start:146 stop:316 length:171 start_codon:yes stop_codon:yes gene_type:complete
MPTRAKYAKMTKYKKGGAVKPQGFKKGGAVKGYSGGGAVTGGTSSQTSGRRNSGIH